MQKLRLTTLMGCLLLAPSVSKAAQLVISGLFYPGFDVKKPSFWMGGDPIVGRLTCPTLTRLNLSKKRSEGLLLKSVASKSRKWIYQIKDGIYWWSGEKVDGNDLKTFFEATIRGVVASKSASLWEVPDYEIVVEGRKLIINWQSEPIFSSYIFNDTPFYRSLSNESQGVYFECAGIYRLGKSESNIVLSDTQKYGKRKNSKIVLKKKGSNTKQTSDIDFAAAGEEKISVKLSPPDKPAWCDQKVLRPLSTLILWNPKSSVLTDEKLRKLMTEITPRGAILRSGARFLGRLSTAPIHRIHPGYNDKAKILPFRTRDVRDEYRKSGGALNKEDRIKLRLGVPREHRQVLGRVLKDAYTLAGIDLELKDPSESGLDGSLQTLYLPWPSMNLIGSLHSSRSEGIFKGYSDNELDEVLEKYALEVTKEHPSFSHLKKVHQALYQKEPFTMLLNHSSCLRVTTKYSRRFQKVSSLDPDWFKRNIH